MTLAPPVLYFSFADQEERHLAFLEEELESIKDKLRNKQSRNQIIFVKEDKIKIATLLKDLPSYRDKLLLFHYAGHAAGNRLDFVGQSADAEGLADFFKNYPRLKLVFLNGCSTEEQVKGLIEAGVDAVIATSVEISDSRARDFAIQFYHSFVSNGSDLKTAYKEATKTVVLPHQHTKEPIQVDGLEITKVKVPSQHETPERAYQIIGKPVDMRGQGLPDFSDILPWGLYYSKADILDWKIEDDYFKEEQFIRAMTLAQKERELTSLQGELEALDHQAAQLSEDLQQLAPTDNQAISLSEQLVQLNQQRNRMAKKQKDLKVDIMELKEGEEAQLRLAINQINYKDQWASFEDWKIQQQIGAFLIQGSPKCGHSLLVEELLPKYILNFSKDRYRPLLINFGDINHNNSYEKAAIWNMLRIKLDLRRGGGPPAARIAEKLAELLRKQHLVLLFDEVNHLAAEAIGQFWKELHDLMHLAHPDLPAVFPNRLLLVLLDRYTELAPDVATGKPRARTYAKYKAAFDRIPAPVHLPSIMEPILPLELSDLKKWLEKSKLPDGCWPDDPQIEKILQESEGYVLPMIRIYCREIGRSNIYDHYYSNYDFFYDE